MIEFVPLADVDALYRIMDKDPEFVEIIRELKEPSENLIKHIKDDKGFEWI